jgi:hypothetical protein
MVPLRGTNAEDGTGYQPEERPRDTRIGSAVLVSGIAPAA